CIALHRPEAAACIALHPRRHGSTPVALPLPSQQWLVAMDPRPPPQLAAIPPLDRPLPFLLRVLRC
ncbi:unnamed protein product, partial [Urochloa humidicola]